MLPNHLNLSLLAGTDAVCLVALLSYAGLMRKLFSLRKSTFENDIFYFALMRIKLTIGSSLDAVWIMGSGFQLG